MLGARAGLCLVQLKAAQILGRTDPNASLKRGLVLWTYGKNKEAEDATRAGTMTGNLADRTGRSRPRAVGGREEARRHSGLK
jgi:hypothetical protein